MADGPVSRILCRTQTAKQPAHAAIIPLGHGSHRDSSSLPEGFPSTMVFLPTAGKHHRQRERVHFLERLIIEPGRLSPPIWPCTTRGFPCPRCHHRSGGLLPHLFTLANVASISSASHRSPCAMPPRFTPPAVYSLWHFP